MAKQRDRSCGGASGWLHLDVDRIVRETEAAFLVDIKDGEQTWLPKSQVKNPGDYNQGDTNVTISITEWIARQKNLMD